jgi:hypothetical protein
MTSHSVPYPADVKAISDPAAYRAEVKVRAEARIAARLRARAEAQVQLKAQMEAEDALEGEKAQEEVQRSLIHAQERAAADRMAACAFAQEQLQRRTKILPGTAPVTAATAPATAATDAPGTAGIAPTPKQVKGQTQARGRAEGETGEQMQVRLEKQQTQVEARTLTEADSQPGCSSVSDSVDETDALSGDTGHTGSTLASTQPFEGKSLTPSSKMRVEKTNHIYSGRSLGLKTSPVGVYRPKREDGDGHVVRRIGLWNEQTVPNIVKSYGRQ